MKPGSKRVFAVVLCAQNCLQPGRCRPMLRRSSRCRTAATLDTAELTLDITEGDPAPVAYLNVQAPNDYFLIWLPVIRQWHRWTAPARTGHAEGTADVTARNERGEKTALYHHGAQKHSQPPGAEHQRAGAYHYRAGACPDEAAEAGTEQRRVHRCAAVGQQQPGGGIGKHKRHRKGAGGPARPSSAH